MHYKGTINEGLLEQFIIQSSGDIYFQLKTVLDHRHIYQYILNSKKIH